MPAKAVKRGKENIPQAKARSKQAALLPAGADKVKKAPQKPATALPKTSPRTSPRGKAAANSSYEFSEKEHASDIILLAKRLKGLSGKESILKTLKVQRCNGARKAARKTVTAHAQHPRHSTRAFAPPRPAPHPDASSLRALLAATFEPTGVSSARRRAVWQPGRDPRSNSAVPRLGRQCRQGAKPRHRLTQTQVHPHQAQWRLTRLRTWCTEPASGLRLRVCLTAGCALIQYSVHCLPAQGLRTRQPIRR